MIGDIEENKCRKGIASVCWAGCRFIILHKVVRINLTEEAAFRQRSKESEINSSDILGCKILGNYNRKHKETCIRHVTGMFREQRESQCSCIRESMADSIKKKRSKFQLNSFISHCIDVNL